MSTSSWNPSWEFPPTVHFLLLHFLPLCTYIHCVHPPAILPPIMHFLLLYFLPLCTSLCSSSCSTLTQFGLQCFLLGRSPAADCPVLTPSSAVPPVGTHGAATASFPGHEELTQPPLPVAAGIWPRIHPWGFCLTLAPSIMESFNSQGCFPDHQFP